MFHVCDIASSLRQPDRCFLSNMDPPCPNFVMTHFDVFWRIASKTMQPDANRRISTYAGWRDATFTWFPWPCVIVYAIFWHRTSVTYDFGLRSIRGRLDTGEVRSIEQGYAMRTQGSCLTLIVRFSFLGRPTKEYNQIWIHCIVYYFFSLLLYIS